MSMRTLLLLAVLLLPTARALSADRFVATAGSDTGNCSGAAMPCRTPDYALTQAASGDTVKLAGGTYPGNLTIDTSTTLTISGGWTSDFAVRDPVANRSSVLGVAGMSSLPGLQFSDILIVHASSGDTIALTVDGVSLRRGSRGIHARADGNGILDLQVVDSVVQGNFAMGIGVGASDTSTVSVDVSRTHFLANVNSRGVQFSHIAMGAHSASTVPMTVKLSDSRIERNRAVQGITGGVGVGVDFGGQLSLEVERCVFTKNRDGALSSYVGYPNGTIDVTVRDSLFEKNKDRSASAMRFENSNVTISNTRVSKNVTSADNGSAVLFYDSSGAIVNSTVSGNRGAFGVALSPIAPVTLRNTILWGQRSASGADLLVPAGAVVDADHNDIGVISGAGVPNDLGGNISDDPGFASGRDLRLTPGSPCVDAGTCTGAPTADFEGDPRPTGTGCDIGADELVP